MQLTHPHELPRLLGRSAYIVYSLICLAELEGTAPVGRQWLVDNMPGPVSPATITQALHVLTGPEVQLVVRVPGGWQRSAQAFQLPLAWQLHEKDSESSRYSDNTKYADSTKYSQNTRGGGGVESELALSTITPPPPAYRGEKFSEDPKDSGHTNSPHIRACLDTLREYGVYGRKARELAQLEWVTPEYIRAHMEQTRSEAGELKSPVGLAVYRIQEGAPLPKKRRKDDDDDRSKYITGRYAEFIEH